MSKRRTFSPEHSLQVVLELLSGAKTNAQICREHQLVACVVSVWRDQFVEREPAVCASPASQSLEQERMAGLERLAGRLALELEVTKKHPPL